MEVKMTVKELIESAVIGQYLDDLCEEGSIYMWNEYVEYQNYEERIYGLSISDLLEHLPYDREQMLLEVLNSSINLNHSYFSFDGQGNYVTFDRPFGEESPADWDQEEMIDFISTQAPDLYQCEHRYLDSKIDELLEKLAENVIKKMTLEDCRDLAIEMNLVNEDDDFDSENDRELVLDDMIENLAYDFDMYAEVDEEDVKAFLEGEDLSV